MYSKWTKIFIGLTIAAIAVYDVWVIGQSGTKASISWTIWELSAGDCDADKKAWPLVPLIAGVVVGHLFWQMRPKKEGE